MANDMGFYIEGWDEFVKNFAQFVDMWDAKKRKLLERMGNIYRGEVMRHVPVDTSHLIDHIDVYGDGIPLDYIEVGTNVEYALYVNDGHVQHKRFLPADRLSVNGKAKYIKGGAKGIMLSERYISGAFFMEKGLDDAKPRLTRLVNSFMEQCAREVEGGKL